MSTRSTERRSSPRRRRRSALCRSSRPRTPSRSTHRRSWPRLDYASRGRGGWIATRITDPAAGRAWGRPLLTEQADIEREQRDSIAVVRKLWDSWEDDAVIRDYASGRFLDRDKLHYVDFEGESFTVKGPAIVPRPPQGQLGGFRYARPTATRSTSCSSPKPIEMRRLRRPAAATGWRSSKSTSHSTHRTHPLQTGSLPSIDMDRRQHEPGSNIREQQPDSWRCSRISPPTPTECGCSPP